MLHLGPDDAAAERVLVVLLVVGACAWLAARGAKHWRYCRLLGRIPSPTNGAGHVRALSSPRRHRLLLRWSTEMGPVFLLRLYWMRVVVLTDPELISALFKRSVESQKTAQHAEVNLLVSPKGLPGIFSALSTASPYWRLVRKGTANAFNAQNLRKGFWHIASASQEVCDMIAGQGPGAVVDVDNLLQREALDVIGRVGFNHEFGAIRGCLEPDNVYGDIFQHVNAGLAEVTLRMANPLRRHLWFLPSVREGMRHCAAFQHHMEHLLKAIRARGPPADGDTSLAAHLLRLRDPCTGEPLPDERLLPEIGTLFIAGFDTTGHSMAWTLYLLAQHPEAEARVCEELGGLGLLASSGSPSPRQATFEDLGRMPFLTACIKESMRMLPVAADGTPRSFPHDLVLHGYTIPAGTVVWMYLFALHNSPRIWKDPEIYMPERWLVPGTEYYSPPHATKEKDSKGKAGAAAAQSVGEAVGEACCSLRFVPFGQGARQCIGQGLAKLNYTATLATLLGRFHFQLAPEMESAGAAQECDTIRLTLQPAKGMKMVCHTRA